MDLRKCGIIVVNKLNVKLADGSIWRVETISEAVRLLDKFKSILNPPSIKPVDNILLNAAQIRRDVEQAKILLK